jgi:hypothetical protein
VLRIDAHRIELGLAYRGRRRRRFLQFDLDDVYRRVVPTFSLV